MHVVAQILVGFVAFIHVYILILEMFLWDTPKGRKVFGTTPEFSAASAVLAKNQGLYNGLLAAGLVWGLVAGEPLATPVQTFFLALIAVAGFYGGLTAKKSIWAVQMAPALIALAVLRFPF